MQHRNPILALLQLVPIVGTIWLLVWLVSTKREMNAKFGTKAVTAWVMLVPFIGPLWLLFSYAGAASKVHGQYSPIVGGLVFFVPVLGPFLHQSAFNAMAQRGGGMAMQQAR